MSDVFTISPIAFIPDKIVSVTRNSNSNYIRLQSEFLNRNYGYYATRFIDKITEDAIRKQSIIQVISSQKILTQIVRKFMLGDLQLVFVGHICELLDWNINCPFVEKHSKIFKCADSNLHSASERFILLLNLTAYFVKNYVGQLSESQAISQFLEAESNGQWEKIYQQWLKNCSSQLFNLSPRNINNLFTIYSRDCQKITQTKNYNQMVDNILQLSTTYSMMPGEAKLSKKRILQLQQKQQLMSEGRKIVKKTNNEGGEVRYQQSRLSNSFFQSKIQQPRKNPEPITVINNSQRKIKLKSKQGNRPPVSSHVADFFTHANGSNNQIRATEGLRAESTIGFRDPCPSFLDFGGRHSSRYQPIPYTLRSNSNISQLWK